MATTTSTPRPANDDDQLSSRFASREKNTLARPGRPAHTILEIRKMGSVPVPKDHILIVFIRDLPPSLIQELKADFPEHELQVHRSDPGIPVPKELWRWATVIVTFHDLPDPEDAENVKLIHTISAGIDHLIHKPCIKNTNITLTSSSGLHGPPIAEWCVMNWLVASRSFISTFQAQQQHRWGGVEDYMHKFHDQVGKKIGILGYGSIGRQIARASAALGMTVYAYTASPRPTPESRRDTGYIVPGTGDKEGTIPVSWHHGLDKESIHSFLSLGLDHLVLSLPLTPQTTRLIGAEEFALLSEHCTHRRCKPYLTNISRGKVINQDALIDALGSGLLSGAALDVADPEPLPRNHPLWDTPNLQLSPHVSSLGIEYFPRAMEILKMNLGRMERGEELINEFKRTKGY